MNWYRVANLNLRFENIHEDSIGSPGDAQHKYVLVAYEGDEPRGYIEYSVYRDEIHVDYIFVGPRFRRMGVGTALWKELERIAGGSKINRGYSTDEGTAFLSSVDDPYREYGV